MIDPVVTGGLVLAGWLAMIFAPSGLVALTFAATGAVTASWIAHRAAEGGDPASAFLAVAPPAFVAIVIAWPVARLVRSVARAFRA